MSEKLHIWEKTTELQRQREKLNKAEHEALEKARGEGLKSMTRSPRFEKRTIVGGA